MFKIMLLLTMCVDIFLLILGILVIIRMSYHEAIAMKYFKNAHDAVMEYYIKRNKTL